MFKLKMYTLDGKQEVHELKSLILPTSDGNRTVLSKHMDVCIEVTPGVAKLRTEKGVERYFVADGLFHFQQENGILIVSSFENEKTVDFQRAHKALDEAKQLLHESKNTLELKKAEQALKRAIGRLRLE